MINEIELKPCRDEFLHYLEQEIERERLGIERGNTNCNRLHAFQSVKANYLNTRPIEAQLQAEIERLRLITDEMIERGAIAIRTTEISDVPYSHEYLANSKILAKACLEAALKVRNDDTTS